MTVSMRQVPPDERPLSARQLKYIDAYFATQDVEKAAISIGESEDFAAQCWKDKRVRAEIKKREDILTTEKSKVIAKRFAINRDMLDANLKQLVTLPKKVISAEPSLAATKGRAIELGYKRIGMLIDGNFVPDESSESTTAEAPRIFRATESQILTHTITETRQQIVHREVEASAPAGVPAPIPTAPPRHAHRVQPDTAWD